MTILALQYFIVAAEELNITSAAEKLYITQQTLSAHIKRLETEFSVPLFERKPKLQLTPAGKKILQYARRIVQLQRMMTSEIVDISQKKTSSLIVACSRIRAKFFLTQIWIEYHKICPNIDIRIINDFSRNLGEAVRSRRADVSILLYTVPEPNLTMHPVLKEKLFFIISPEWFHTLFPENTREKFDSFFANGITWQDLVNIPMLLLDYNNRIRELINQEFEKLDYFPRARFESNDSETLLTMALSGCGPTILGEATVFYMSDHLTKELNNVFAFPIVGSAIDSSVALPTDIVIPEFEQVFVEVCRQVFARAKTKMSIREKKYIAQLRYR